MDKKLGIIVGVILVAFAGLVGVSFMQSQSAKIDYDKYDIDALIEPDEANGNIGDLVTGDRNAPVILFEYGDYQCDACAPMNPYVNQLVEEYDGQLAVVFRTDIMDYPQNGTAAASAANAAALQGYWKEYKDKLFNDLDDWFYSSANKRQDQFEEFFLNVSNGQGDLNKFRQDMRSKDVSQKIKFDNGLSERRGIEFTPTFYLNGEHMDQRNKSTPEFLEELRTKIDAILKEKGIEVKKKS